MGSRSLQGQLSLKPKPPPPDPSGRHQNLHIARPEFVPAVILPEHTVKSPAALSSTRMEIIISANRRIIVDAGVDATALSRVLDVLERRRPIGPGR